MATDTQSPARDAATSSTTTTTTTSWRGRGRGRGRGGRGRGGGRGGAAAAAAVAKTTTAPRGRGGLRRGRAKHFTDSRVQAAYERQRDLKATYQAVAHALKPALAELAERSVDDMLANPEAHKQSPEYRRVMDQLKQNLANKFALYGRRLKHDLKLADDLFAADQYLAEQEYENGFNDLDEQFFESQENRLRILNALLDRGLPVDIQDDQYEYVVISDEHLDSDFGTYTCFKDGAFVPYPSRVEGTEMWQRARDAETAAAAPAPSSAPSGRGRGRGRGGIKRRAADQPDGQPTPKKSARLMDDSSLLESPHIAPAPAKGLLASAAVVEDPVEGTPADEDSTPASPEPVNLFNGISSAAYNRAQGKLLTREKSPPLPKNIGEPDEYGLRVYNQRPSLREKSANSRVLAPHVFHWNDWEIGFRDSVNDSSKGHTRAKRGKYLDKPDSNGMHFDHWCNGYDFSVTKPEDFDQDLVRKHGVHPKFGIFLPTSTNEAEPPTPYVMPGKPIVFIANPSGRISHASRSFQATNNTRRSDDAPLRVKLAASMRRFCKMAEIDKEDVSVADYLPTEEELKAKSLGTAVKELKARPPEREETAEAEEEEAATPAAPTEDPEALRAAMSVVSYAALMLEAQDASRAPAPKPKPAARYDAIRDIFNDVKPTPAPVQDHTTGLGLSVLAELCNVRPRPNDGERPSTAYPPMSTAAPESDARGGPGQYPGPARVSAESGMAAPELPPDTAAGQRPPSSMYRPLGPPIAPGSERHSYPSGREHPPAYPNPPSHDYKTHPPPSLHDLGAFPPHPGYPGSDSRDSQPPPGRGYESSYSSRRMSGYMPESSYNRPYWGQSQPPSAPPKASSAQLYPAPPPPPPPQSSRLSFAQSVSAEPLPPLRPPRGRNSLPGEGMLDPGLRPGEQPGSAGSYYNPGHTRPFHMYPAPDQPSSMQLPASERILSALQQGGPGTSSGYMASPPPQPYPPTNPMLSPTFANPPLLSSQLAAQSPPDTPQGPPSSIRRHQSTPSGSSDAGSGKYRKLQPAPVPAHRTWSSKQELKTIPYDHKETGSAAALPQSGPTQIRGWNVNAHKKRGGSKADKIGAAPEASPSQEREESR